MYTYTVSRVTNTDAYRAHIWTSLGMSLSLYVMSLYTSTTDCISVLLSQYYDFILFTKYKVI